ncbi:hypothetical protein [Collinsella sp. An268]|uniref:hypothetical protein n=1 Tax=Collinsella sp. An268 TaxID=1965612 RepID=UPI000B37001D|nr:hypothetical protein [Collinsella sp. An268]OUO65101.1 hypothetical protein B5F70_00055 [Collinsella sp. An268]
MKKLVTAIAAAAMMFALPGVAMAAESSQFNSPAGTTVTDTTSGVALAVSGDIIGDGFIHVEVTDKVASNVPEGVTPIASFEVTKDDGVEINGQLSFVFSVGTQYAGATATIYIQHDGGATETQTATVAADGTITIAVDKLSVFSVVIDESTIPAGGATTDTSATSPQTNATVAPVAMVTTVAVLGAGAAAVALRKKVNE